MNLHVNEIQRVKLATDIFEEHANLIRTTISIHANNKSDIDDIFQNFFLSLVQKPVPTKIKNIRGYLSKAIKNDVLDSTFQTKNLHLRNRKYTQLRACHSELSAPDEIAIHAEDIRQLFELVENQLLPHESEAIIQKFRHGKNTCEAAEAMGIKKRSFSHCLSIGLKKLYQLVHGN
jgi:RNA polymerase sigma factor (sigma-70 family)